MDIVILESPNKVKKVGGYLPGAKVMATVGHFKDLPEKEMGVDLATYEPDFKATDRGRDVVRKLREAAKGNDIYIATDPDREGYAIATHVYDEVKKAAKSVKRVEFHEITEKHIKTQMKAAVDFTKTNHGLYDAFLGRRVGDRLVGYLMSPKASRDIGGKFSVGRVQSPAVRIIVDREREIRNFKPEAYYTVNITCEKQGKTFIAGYESDRIKNKADAQRIAEKIKQARHAMIKNIETKEVKRNPYAPFTTSTLQQAASAVLKISPERTMQLAQALFEAGEITYHRSDSTRLAEEFTTEARAMIQQDFGRNYLPESVRVYKSKNSQADAHEAIRPTHCKPLSSIIQELKKEGLGAEHISLFELIYKRAVACQMNSAVYDQTIALLDVNGEPFKATGRVTKFDGFLKLMSVSEDDDKPKNDKEEEGRQVLPHLTTNEQVRKTAESLAEKFTKPPSRFTEGLLVKQLEKNGIGRPSTYASIMGTIKKKEYVEAVKGQILPTKKGELLIDYLTGRYPWVVDYNMTKQMEEYLDSVEDGKKDWKAFIKDIHGRLGNMMAGKDSGFISEKAKLYALDLAKAKGEDISGIMGDQAKIKEYLEANASKGASDKQMAFAKSLAEKSGKALPAGLEEDKQKLSKWIDKNKTAGMTLSEKQRDILIKNGQEKLADNYAKGKKWIDDYFKKKGFTKSSSKAPWPTKGPSR